MAVSIIRPARNNDECDNCFYLEPCEDTHCCNSISGYGCEDTQIDGLWEDHITFGSWTKDGKCTMKRALFIKHNIETISTLTILLMLAR